MAEIAAEAASATVTPVTDAIRISATSDKLWRKTRDHITTSGNRDIREIAKRLVEAMDEISNAADAVAWGHFAALPLTIEAKDGVQIMATIEDVRSSFEQNLATLKNAGITDVVRVVEEVHVPSPGVMIITCHDNVLRHGRHISKPWRSEITLIDVNGYWRLSRIIRAHLRHADNPVP